MVFGGIQKTSLIDYPGKISCVLFSFGCNFRCPYCHNPELIKESSPSSSFEKTKIYNHLKNRKGLLEGVVLSGGEPTIHEDLLNYCLAIKSLDYSVKLDTNGSRPDVLTELMKHNAIDYIAMDIKTDPAGYEKVSGYKEAGKQILASIQILKSASIPFEFRTTCVKPFVSPDIMRKIATFAYGADRYVLQRFHPKQLLMPEFFRGQNPGYGDKELLQLKEIIAPAVRECIVV
jgi:pyruvate formate lyase activating enzyme